MRMGFPREKNMEREEKVAQDGALREGRQEKNFRKVGRVPGEYSERLDGMRLELLALV